LWAVFYFDELGELLQSVIVSFNLFNFLRLGEDRFMNLHEYQAKALFADYGLPVPVGHLIRSLTELAGAYQQLPTDACVVKAQIHAGARGKAGGVVLAKNLAEAETAATRLLGSRLATHQTAGKALPVDALLIEQTLDIQHEYYLSLLLDRVTKRYCFVVSSEGGMDIEEVASTQPEKIHRFSVDPLLGVMPYQAREMGFALGLTGTAFKALGHWLNQLYTLAIERDLMQVEINPLVSTADGQLVALDAKVNIDSNALYRQPGLLEQRDMRQEDAREAEASSHQLNYIALEGTIGCMVNGAGLAMATMDLIQLQGGKPANFLDVGGGTTPARVAAAFKLILSDPDVKAILVNIFGGIVRCDLIAEGIISAVKEVGLTLPVVVRLEGTNAELGRKMLADSGLSIEAANDLAQAAARVVELASQGGAAA